MTILNRDHQVEQLAKVEEKLEELLRPRRESVIDLSRLF